jgi:hypothetical protein
LEGVEGFTIIDGPSAFFCFTKLKMLKNDIKNVINFAPVGVEPTFRQIERQRSYHLDDRANKNDVKELLDILTEEYYQIKDATCQLLFRKKLKP